MSFWEKIQTVDKRWLYLLLLGAIILPLLVPFEQKITPSSLPKGFYNSIDALKPGSVVVISIDHVPATLNELGGGEVAAISHLKSKGAKIIFWCIAFPEASLIYETKIQPLMKDKVYGEDYVNFGYITGKESAAEMLGKDIHGFLKTDAYGKSIDALPLMKKVNGAKDVSLLITFDDGSATIMWMLQWVTTHKTKLLSGATAGIRATLEPYIKAGQISGLLAGAPGVAEYETLLQKPGIGIQQINALSSTSAFLLIVILVSVIGCIGEKVMKK